MNRNGNTRTTKCGLYQRSTTAWVDHSWLNVGFRLPVPCFNTKSPGSIQDGLNSKPASWFTPGKLLKLVYVVDWIESLFSNVVIILKFVMQSNKAQKRPIRWKWLMVTIYVLPNYQMGCCMDTAVPFDKHVWFRYLFNKIKLTISVLKTLLYFSYQTLRLAVLQTVILKRTLLSNHTHTRPFYFALSLIVFFDVFCYLRLLSCRNWPLFRRSKWHKDTVINVCDQRLRELWTSVKAWVVWGTCQKIKTKWLGRHFINLFLNEFLIQRKYNFL